MIEVKNVTKRYQLGQRYVDALKGVNLTINEGEFSAIVGSSGCGKSTLLHLMGCLDTPTDGNINIMGQTSTLLSDKKQSALRNRYLGFIFQSFNLIPVLNAFENIEYPLLLQKVPKKQRSERVMSLLERVGLQEHKGHRPDKLSGGQRQRVAIARALVTQPKLVLADEPTANLDSQTTTEILDLMKEINQSLGTSFVISTHDPDVSRYANAIYTLQDGRLVP